MKCLFIIFFVVAFLPRTAGAQSADKRIDALKAVVIQLKSNCRQKLSKSALED